MIRVLSDGQITEVEAVYLCLFDRALTLDFQLGLIRRIYDVKMIDEPKPRRNYNRNYYYAKTKKLCKCNYCGKLITTPTGMAKHLVTKRCLKAQALRNRMEIDT